MNQTSAGLLRARPSATPPRPRGGFDAAEADRLALAVTRACAEAEQLFGLAIRARQDEQVAWMVLCDRGWPPTSSAASVDFVSVTLWVGAWTELVALPTKVWKPHDLLKLRQVRRRLGEAEDLLRPVLPASLWSLVDPLDDTGRATLSFILQALSIWRDATRRVASSTRTRKALAQRFVGFAASAASLALDPPDAPLDLDAWKKVAVAAACMAHEQRQLTSDIPLAAQYP